MEVVTWNTLQHRNVLPPIGVTNPKTQLVMVSDWVVTRNINNFVKAHLNTNRIELVPCLFELSPPSLRVQRRSDNWETSPGGWPAFAAGEHVEHLNRTPARMLKTLSGIWKEFRGL